MREVGALSRSQGAEREARESPKTSHKRSSLETYHTKKKPLEKLRVVVLCKKGASFFSL